MKVRSGHTLMLCFWSHQSNCWRSYTYSLMEVFKCCKRCFYVLVEDDHCYSICTKPAFNYKSIDSLSPDVTQTWHLQNCQTTLVPPVFLPQPWSCISPTRFRHVESKAAKCIQRYTGQQQRLISPESNHTLRIQTQIERHVARLKPLLASVRRCGAQSKLSISVNLSLCCHQGLSRFWFLSHSQNT